MIDCIVNEEGRIHPLHAHHVTNGECIKSDVLRSYHQLC